MSSLLQINHPMSIAASRTQEVQHVRRRRWLCDVGLMMTGRVPTECSAAVGHFPANLQLRWTQVLSVIIRLPLWVFMGTNYVQKDVPISLLLKVNLPSFLVKSLINFKLPFLWWLNQLNSPRIPTKSWWCLSFLPFFASESSHKSPKKTKPSIHRSTPRLEVVRDSGGAVITCVGGPSVRGLSSSCPQLRS